MRNGSIGPITSWTQRLLEIAVVLVVIGLLLNWAWLLIRPFVPAILVVAGLSATVTFLVRRNQRW